MTNGIQVVEVFLRRGLNPLLKGLSHEAKFGVPAHRRSPSPDRDRSRRERERGERARTINLPDENASSIAAPRRRDVRNERCAASHRVGAGSPTPRPTTCAGSSRPHTGKRSPATRSRSGARNRPLASPSSAARSWVAIPGTGRGSDGRTCRRWVVPCSSWPTVRSSATTSEPITSSTCSSHVRRDPTPSS